MILRSIPEISADGTFAFLEGTQTFSGNKTFTGTNLVTSGSLTFSDSTLLDLSAINDSSTTEGLKLPQTSNCNSATAQGQICWDSTAHNLYVGNATTTTLIAGGSAAAITAVGNITSGAAFTSGVPGLALYFSDASAIKDANGNNLLGFTATGSAANYLNLADRSEARRVGKECRSRWSPYH